MKDPVEYARMRYKQNIIANLSESAYQRQTGRTFRLMIHSLEMIKKNVNVVILADRNDSCKRISEQLHSWLGELKMAASMSPGRRDTILGDTEYKVRANSGGSVTVCTPSKFLEVSRGFKQDVVLFDNSVTDLNYESPSDEFTDTVREAYGACIRKDMMSELRDFQGRSWSLDSLFLLPDSKSVGSVISIIRAAFVPTAVSVLHEGNIYTFPMSACDIFIKPGEKTSS
jgi:hypothetical protein